MAGVRERKKRGHAENNDFYARSEEDAGRETRDLPTSTSAQRLR